MWAFINLIKPVPTIAIHVLTGNSKGKYNYITNLSGTGEVDIWATTFQGCRLYKLNSATNSFEVLISLLEICSLF